MANRPHRFFRNSLEGSTKYKQKPRYSGDQKDDENLVKNYEPKKEDFIRSIHQFNDGKTLRELNRSPTLNLPAFIDLIEITFHDYFDSSTVEKRYREKFGLSPVSYTIFNTVGLFAIVSKEQFDFFIEQLDIFIKTSDHLNPKYDTYIRFIKEFTFYSTQKIVQYKQYEPHIIVDIIDNVDLFQNLIQPIENRLIQYIENEHIQYYLDLDNNKIELLNPTENQIKIIADNFDIVQSINSYASGFVSPNAYNLPVKGYGFNITNAHEELPIIGIIDTGISSDTPLKDLIVNKDNSLNLTSSPLTIDEANHGTGVATIAALGKRLYPNHIGNFESDAKLLSIKILNGQQGYIVESEVIRLIRNANKIYGVQIFTLTIGYKEYKRNNEGISDYAYALDKLTNELNILIFIAITNNNNDLVQSDSKIVKYPFHFENENSNLCSPAESMNNITIGAIASNLEGNDLDRISPVGTVPAIYTRTFHVNWKHASILNRSGKTNWLRANKKIFKPDVCECGGDYDKELYSITTGIKVLSNQTGIFFERNTGTSYSAPFVANLAARILKMYPELGKQMQTVKALIINSSMKDEMGDALKGLKVLAPEAIMGHGVPSDTKCIYSSDNFVTIILENIILPEDIILFPIKIPRYLVELNHANGVINIKATLCFKFKPLKHHHTAYCPIHLAFGFFKNKDLENYIRDDKGKLIPTGINNNKTEVYVFSESWSQDYYYKPKMLSNTQQISFSVSKKVIIEEDYCLKIAVNSKLHKLLNDLDKSKLKDVYVPFSLVFTIEEKSLNKIQTGRLYEELNAINDLEAVNTLDATLEAEN